MFRVVFEDIDTELQAKLTATTPANGQFDSERIIGNDEPPNYITFDGEGIPLYEEDLKFAEEGDYFGWIPATVSDEYSNHFTSLSINTDSLISVFGDNTLYLQVYDDSLISVEMWFETLSGAIFNEAYVENGFLEIAVPTNASGVTISSFRTRLPYQFPKISSIKVGKIDVFENVKSYELLEETNVLSDDSPMNSFGFSIVSKEKPEFEFSRPCKLYYKNKYFGTYYIDTAEKMNSTAYDISAYGPLFVLENTMYEGWYESAVDLETLTNSITALTGVKITSNVDLSEYYVFGHIPPKSCRYVLCAAAFVCGFMIDDSRSDEISLINIPSEITSVITTKDKRIIGECTFEKAKPSKTVSLVYPYEVTLSEPKEIKFNNLANQRMKYYFENAPFGIDTTGITDAGGTVHNDSLNLIDFTSPKANVSVVGQEFIFKKQAVIITSVLSTATGSKEYSDFLLCGFYKKQTEETQTRIKKETDIQKMLNSSGKIKGKIILQNERVGDLIKIETANEGMKTGIITSMNVSLGYKNVATIEAIEWS